MGHAARANPRSMEGMKYAPLVEWKRLEVAPLGVLVRTWWRLVWAKVRRHA